MVRDLAEFGWPHIVLNTSKVSFVSRMDNTTIVAGTAFTDRPLIVRIVCDGAIISLEFRATETQSWEQCFEFFKRCGEENA